MNKDTSNEKNFLNKVHGIAQKTVSISSTKHMLGLSEEQKRIVEEQIDKITAACQVLSDLVSKHKK